MQNPNSGISGSKSVAVKTTQAAHQFSPSQQRKCDCSGQLFSHSVMSDSLWAEGLQHVRLPCPQSPGVCSNHVLWVSDAIQPSHPLLSPSLSIFPSCRVFSYELAFHIRGVKYSSFSFNISPSNEYSELISFRIDWFNLVAVQDDSQESSPLPQFKSINS